MFTEDVTHDMRETLLKHGYAYMCDINGKRLYFVHTKLLRLDFTGLLVAYEGYGAFTYDMDRPVNAFRLVSAGFPLQVAGGLAYLINRLTGVAVNPVAKTALSRRAKAHLLPYKAKRNRRVLLLQGSSS